jgi:hypothetical protein
MAHTTSTPSTTTLFFSHEPSAHSVFCGYVDSSNPTTTSTMVSTSYSYLDHGYTVQLTRLPRHLAQGATRPHLGTLLASSATPSTMFCFYYGRMSAHLFRLWFLLCLTVPDVLAVHDDTASVRYILDILVFGIIGFVLCILSARGFLPSRSCTSIYTR